MPIVSSERLGYDEFEMNLILAVFVLPVAYLILAAFRMLPRDEGMLALVFLNSVAWTLHYKLRNQVRQEMRERTISTRQQL